MASGENLVTTSATSVAMILNIDDCSSVAMSNLIKLTYGHSIFIKMLGIGGYLAHVSKRSFNHAEAPPF